MKNITAFVVTLLVAIQTANCSQVLDSKFDVSPNPAQPGQSIEARLDVGPSAGKVQFYVDGQLNGQEQLVADGVAVTTIAGLDAGEHTVSVAYRAAGVEEELLLSVLVNTAPAVCRFGLGATQDKPASFPESCLLDTARDADGNHITLIHVDARSKAGAAVTRISDLVTYTPLSGFTGKDTVGYQVADSYGATSNGVIEVSVNPSTQPKLCIESGRLLVMAPIGMNVTVQSSTNLFGWTDLHSFCATTATTAIDGFKSSDRPLRFYRIVPQP